MKIPTITHCVKTVVLALFLGTAMTSSAQSLRTTYFMDGVQYRMQLNPALAPSRGFVHLPAVSNTGAALRSNSFCLEDIIDIIKNKDDADYFIADRFMTNLRDENHALANARTDLAAAGWWQGRNFWSFNIGVRVDGSLSVPRDLFTYMRDMKGLNDIDYSNYLRDIGKEQLDFNAYAEIGVGYARQLNDRLSVGARLKGLLGLGNISLKVNETAVKIALDGLSPDFDWSNPNDEQLRNATGTASVDVEAELESSFTGLDLLVNNSGYIDDVDFKSRDMGVSGYGAAVDVGFSYRVTDGLTLSAAINDLGFIKWSKGCTQIAHADTEILNYDSSSPNPDNAESLMKALGRIEALNPDILRLTIDNDGVKSRNTSLASTMALGAEYAFSNDKVSLGALYTNHFARIKNESEITFSVNYRPSTMVNLTASYSPVMCGGSSFGVAVKCGPLFVGTDYMYLDKNTKCCNALVGISVPIGAKPEF